MRNHYFEQLPHTADIKIRVHADTFEQLFLHSLQAMFLCIEPRDQNNQIITYKTIPSTLDVFHPFTLKAPSQEILLIDFLSEALYLSDTNNEAYFNVIFEKLSSLEAKGTFIGTKINGFEVVEIKAITYHELKVEQNPSGWISEIIFDI